MLLLSLYEKSKRFKKMIIFLRHGQAENNTKKILAGRTPGINLTDEGKKQANQAGKMLESLDISAIYSSPIDRAVQTLSLIHI